MHVAHSTANSHSSSENIAVEFLFLFLLFLEIDPCIHSGKSKPKNCAEFSLGESNVDAATS